MTPERESHPGVPSLDASASALRAHLLDGQVIPAHPLALTACRTLDEPRQRRLTRFYIDSGAGGVAVAVHTTQFAIRDPAHALLRPVLELAADEARERRTSARTPFALIAGAIGATRQAVAEAELAASLGYDMVLLGLGAMGDASDDALIEHCRAVSEVLPLFGFYLQPAVGGRVLGYDFWRRLAGNERVWAIKIAPFNRYRTLDVVRAVSDAGRDDLALYTGNDDNILADLLTPFPVRSPTGATTRHIVGGLLGQWAVWTRGAVRLLERVRAVRAGTAPAGELGKLLRLNAALTDANGAIFDAAHGFAGCIPGIHEVLRREGLLDGTWCLDPSEVLSPGQREEIDRVEREYGRELRE
jgi:dihydrodipicolinate synthase/N-acetylneuraminate lyase